MQQLVGEALENLDSYDTLNSDASNCEPVQARNQSSSSGGHGINFLAKFDDSFADAMALRASSLYPDGSIRNPVVFERSITIRINLIQRRVKIYNQICDAKAVKDFIDALVSVFVTLCPEKRCQIQDRISELELNFDKTGHWCL
jgi:hypothetical protein